MKDTIKERSDMSRENIKEEAPKGTDLLKIKWLKQLIIWKGFPYVFQLLALIIFILLVFLGWEVYTPNNVNDKLFAKSHLVTLLVWGIWWPVMILAAVTMGRVWCMVCPLELVSNITERISRKTGINQIILSRRISGGAFIVALYALIQLLVAGIQMHRVPAYTSYMLAGLLMISVVTGFLFKNRAFCRGFCPIGMLLNAYGRGGMISIRPAGHCADCNGRECTESSGRYKADARSCPSLLNPSAVNSNKDCLICTQCIKSCSKNEMQLLLRKPFDRNNVRERKAGWYLTVFIMIASGFVTYELASEWKSAQEIFLFIPVYFVKEFWLKEIGGFIKGFWTIGVFPLLLWLVLGFAAKVFERTKSVSLLVREMALSLAIIISAGHLTKGLAKLNTWAGFLPGSLNDYSGAAQLAAVNAGISTPGAIMSGSIISILGVLIIAVSFYYSVREENINYGRFHFRIVPKLILACLYSFIIIGMSC